MKAPALVGMLLGAALFVTASAQATTTLARGIVLEVEKDPKTGDSILVRVTWSNYHGEDSICRIEVPPDSVILLDGKLAERTDALKPGHLVKALLDCNYFEFYTRTGQLMPTEAPADPADGCYTLTLEGAVDAAPILAALKQTGAAGKAPLVLHLDCRQDRIVGASSVAKRNGSRIKGHGAPVMEILSRGAFHDVDASGLAVKDGKLTGVLKVRFYGGSKGKPKEGETPLAIPDTGVIATATYALDATIGAADAVSGTYKGAVEKAEVSGNLSGVLRARPALPEAYTVWMRPQPGPDQPEDATFKHGICYVGFRVQGGELKHDHVSGGHSERLGQVDSGTAALQSGQLTADVKLTLKGQTPAKYSLHVESQVIGDVLAGTYRFTNEAGTACGKGRMRGELLAFDCPAPEGWNETAWRKEVARLAEERDAKKKADPPAAPQDRKR